MQTTTKRFWPRLGLLLGGIVVLSLAILTTPVGSQEGDDKDKEADPLTPISQSFVGPLEGGPASARIAVVTEKGQFLVYTCSKDTKFNAAFSRWLKGKIGDKGAIDAASDDGVKVSAEAKGDTIEGVISAPNGQTLKFKANKISACQNAGLYRATDKFGDEEMVAGWIVDEDNGIAGNLQNKKLKQNQNPPQGINNNLGGQLNPNSKNIVNAQKVNSAINPGNGNVGKNPNGKVDPNLRAENLKSLVDRFKGKKNGSPLHAAVLNVLRRSQAGAKATDANDAKFLSLAKKINPKSLKKYLDNWDKLPVGVRNSLLGSSANLASGKTPLTKVSLDGVVAGLKTKIKTGDAAAPQSVKNVQIRQLSCVEETFPANIGSDEIFVVYTVIQGTTVFTPQITKIYTGLDTGETAPFTGADVTVFPPPGQQPAQGSIEITASVFEDDSADNAFVSSLIKGVTDVAVEILKAADKGQFVDAAQAVGDFLDSFVAGLPTTQFLGSDTIVARTNGQLTSVTGQAKNVLTVQRFRNNLIGSGTTRQFRYDLKNIVVTK